MSPPEALLTQPGVVKSEITMTFNDTFSFKSTLFYLENGPSDPLPALVVFSFVVLHNIPRFLTNPRIHSS
jgi:hypothetical protein